MTQRVIDRALALAKEKGLNQRQFGELLGAASANVTNWKVRDLPSNLHAKAAEVLGVTVDQLVGNTRATAGESAPNPKMLTWPLRSISAERFATLPAEKLEQIDHIMAALVGSPAPPDWRSTALALAGELDSVMKTSHHRTFVDTVDKHHVERIAEHRARTTDEVRGPSSQPAP